MISGSARNPKILDVASLAGTVADLKARGRTVVQCHGCFDVLHIGHVRHFQAARRHGDVLVVTVTPDQFVNKGPNRPAFTHSVRAEMLAGLECIDYVAVNEWPEATEAIRRIRPHVYCKGSDYRDASKDLSGGILREEEAIRSVGGDLVFTDEETSSSSRLINRHLPVFSGEVAEFLSGFTEAHDFDHVAATLDRAQKLRVLVIGEAIIDEYHYCETLGKSGKEPILAVRFNRAEKFAGGIMAVANHTAEFADSVDMITMLGRDDPQEEFIRAHLNPRVNPTFLLMEGAPTITKRRYIESYPFQKMFEVYFMREDEAAEANAARLATLLEERLDDYDVVIVTDYGHGMLGPSAIDVLCRRARGLSVNTQTNADNHGFNTVSKYPRADYLCVSEKELRLEARSRRGDVRELMEAAAERAEAAMVMVTQGKQGLLSYEPDRGFARVPAFADHFVDRVGAGDAVFAVTSLCRAAGAHGDEVAFIGNSVGAMAVTIVGNRRSIDRGNLVTFLKTLLK